MISDPQAVFFFRLAAIVPIGLGLFIFWLSGELPPPNRRLIRAGMTAGIALIILMAAAACGGGNVGGDGPPWRQTIEAKCAVPEACPTFPPFDGTPRPTAVTTPNPSLPTATPRPLSAAEALDTRQPAAMTAAAGGMAARATEEAAP